MSWALIADSSCNLRGYTPSAPDTIYRFAPLKVNVGGQEYVDDEALDVAELNRRVAAEESATSSACPSVGEWADRFRSADNVIAITISANLSGSYEAAIMARDLVLEEDGSRNIFIVNSRAAGGKLELLIVALDRYLTEHPDATFNEVTAYICNVEQSSTVLFLLSSYENLAKAGRMPKVAGMLANKLNIRMLGRSLVLHEARRRHSKRSLDPCGKTDSKAATCSSTMSSTKRPQRTSRRALPPNGRLQRQPFFHVEACARTTQRRMVSS